MFMQNDIATDATPLFHIDAPRIDPAVRRSEIEQVIAIVTAAIPRAQMKKLGRLSFAEARDDDDHSYFGQIRSEPVGASGLEFRYPIPARGTGNRDLAAAAVELAEGAVALALGAGKVKDIAPCVREIAETALLRAKGGIAEMKLVAIGLTPGSRSGDASKITVDVEMLGDDLRLGIERVCESTLSNGLDRLEERLTALATKHVERRKALARAKVAAGSGWIDDSALRILDISGLGRADAIDMLRTDRQMNFSFGGEDGYDLMGGVHWDDGVVRGYVERRERGRTFRLEAMVLTIEANGLPATIVSSLVGRHLGEIVEIDYVPGNALIVEAEESGDLLYLRLEIGDTLIEESVPAA